jgi:hypothetical protein
MADDVDERSKAVWQRLQALHETLGKDVSQLWSDAMDFFAESNTRSASGAPDRERLARAAVLTSAAAFESVTNFLAERMAEDNQLSGQPMTESEIDILLERQKVLEGGKVKEKKKLYSSMDRFLLLLSLVRGGGDYKQSSELKRSFEVRNRLCIQSRLVPSGS